MWNYFLINFLSLSHTEYFFRCKFHNKNIKRILRKMVETFRDWSEKLSFALWAYRTSFHTSTRATPYSLVYGMEAVLPVEIEMRSLRVALEQQISKTEWALSHYDQLSCGPAFFTCAPTRSARLAFYLWKINFWKKLESPLILFLF